MTPLNPNLVATAPELLSLLKEVRSNPALFQDKEFAKRVNVAIKLAEKVEVKHVDVKPHQAPSTRK